MTGAVRAQLVTRAPSTTGTWAAGPHHSAMVWDKIESRVRKKAPVTAATSSPAPTRMIGSLRAGPHLEGRVVVDLGVRLQVDLGLRRGGWLGGSLAGDLGADPLEQLRHIGVVGALHRELFEHGQGCVGALRRHGILSALVKCGPTLLGLRPDPRRGG